MSIGIAQHMEFLIHVLGFVDMELNSSMYYNIGSSNECFYFLVHIKQTKGIRHMYLRQESQLE